MFFPELQHFMHSPRVLKLHLQRKQSALARQNLQTWTAKCNLHIWRRNTNFHSIDKLHTKSYLCFYVARMACSHSIHKLPFLKREKKTLQKRRRRRTFNICSFLEMPSPPPRRRLESNSSHTLFGWWDSLLILIASVYQKTCCPLREFFKRICCTVLQSGNMLHFLKGSASIDNSDV